MTYIGLEGSQKSPNPASSFSRSENRGPEISRNLIKGSTNSQCGLPTSTVCLGEGSRGEAGADGIPTGL